MQFEKLISKLDANAKNLLEQSVATASSRSNFAVEIDHLVHQIALINDPELHNILVSTGCDRANLAQQAEKCLATIKTGNSGFPKISPDVTKLVFDAWLVATSEFQVTAISINHIIIALLENQANKLRLTEYYPALVGIALEELQTHTQEQHALNENIPSVTQSSKQPNLAQYTVNLTAEAKNGNIESIIGRDTEVRQIIDILSRKKQNNPILTGEAGVGKTAVIEGLALKIIRGEVPDSLKQVELMSLDMGLLQAGAGVKGEFENRLKGIINEVKQSEKPVILFIDEAHTLIGAGNNSGAGDAANLLKPALARGELRTIAATTWSEYKQYFESDAALTRRFQVVKVEEPSPSTAINMLRHIAPGLESHHNVAILDSAIEAAVNLSHRYITGRQLPDKCVSLLDTACARVNLSLTTEPAAIEQLEAELDAIDTAHTRLTKEQSSGNDHSQQLAKLVTLKSELQTQLSKLRDQWLGERQLVDELISLIKSSTTDSHDQQGQVNLSELSKAQSRIQTIKQQLNQFDRTQALVHYCVTADIIAQVVTDWTGIPVSSLSADEVQNLINLDSSLEQRVIGQKHSLTLISSAIKTSRTGLADPNRPVGVFMLIGPSGVGKTETALALAERLYGSERLINVINMSEFKEEHKVSMLLGAPPGYVGYGKGGVLTEAIRRNPYSVLLLDEIEKAHPGVHDIFYQVFDKGVIKDGEGRDIDFKNTVIIMTSNCASEEISQLCEDIETAPEPEQLLETISPTLRKTFKPAFLGRINLIPYYPLSNDNLILITKLKLKSIQKRIRTSYNANLVLDENFYSWVSNNSDQSDTGARQVDLLLNNTFLPKLSESILNQTLKSNTFSEIQATLINNEEFIFEFLQNN